LLPFQVLVSFKTLLNY